MTGAGNFPARRHYVGQGCALSLPVIASFFVAAFVDLTSYYRAEIFVDHQLLDVLGQSCFAAVLVE